MSVLIQAQTVYKGYQQMTKITAIIFQVLQRCHAVLQEIPAGLRQKRPAMIADSLHHMTACVTFHMAKVG